MDETYPTPPYDSQIEHEMLNKAASNYPMVGGSSLRNPPVRKIVEARISELEKQVAAHKAVLASLDSNPGVETVLDALRKIGI